MSLGELLQFDFLARALLAGMILAVIAPLLGMFLVVRGYSLLADALAHMSLLGVALALLLRIPIFIGALAASLVAAYGIEHLRRSGKIFGEAVVALFLSSSLALSIVILNIAQGSSINMMSYLFGSLTTVRALDVWVLSVLAGVIISLFIYFYHDLFLFALDEDVARVRGVRVSVLSTIFMLLTAMTVTMALQMVGALLVGALLVVPILTAMQLCQGFRRTLAYALFFSLTSVLAGFVAADQLDGASGSAIVMVAVFLFILTYVASRVSHHV